MDIAPNPYTEVLYLLPSEVTIDPRFNVRPYSTLHGSVVAQRERTEELAQDMEKRQLNPCRITGPKAVCGDRVLLGGHRRREAAILINRRLTTLGKPLFRLACIVSQAITLEECFAEAFADNKQREDMSDMDVYLLVQQIREKNKWPRNEREHIKKIAGILGKSITYVTQTEKLEQLSPMARKCLHDRLFARETALDLFTRLNHAEQDVIIRKGLIYKQEEIVDKAVQANLDRKLTPSEAIRKLSDANEPHLEFNDVKHVIEQEYPQALATASPRHKPLRKSREDILSMLTNLNQTPGLQSYPWITFLVEEWAPGIGNSRDLKNAFISGMKRPRIQKA